LNTLHVVGNLDSNIFVVKIDKELYLVDLIKVKETMMYHKLLNEYELPRQALSQPIRLEESKVGMDCWAIATSNSEEYSKLIRFNGFELKRSLVNDHIIVEVVAMSNDIPNYNISDLIDLLQNLATKRGINNTYSLATIRPPSVLNYFVSEAKKNSQIDSSTIINSKELKQFLFKLIASTNHISTTSTCPHENFIFQKLNCLFK
jgi:DNA mismatch repair ATPase MutL